MIQWHASTPSLLVNLMQLTDLMVIHWFVTHHKQHFQRIYHRLERHQKQAVLIQRDKSTSLCWMDPIFNLYLFPPSTNLLKSSYPKQLDYIWESCLMWYWITIQQIFAQIKGLNNKEQIICYYYYISVWSFFYFSLPNKHMP